MNQIDDTRNYEHYEMKNLLYKQIWISVKNEHILFLTLASL